MADRRHSTRSAKPGLLFCCALLVAAGCSQASSSVGSRANAPGLQPDTDRARQNVADPNAPYLLAATSPRLKMRPPLLDSNAVHVCSITQLSIFESQATKDGPRHTVRFTVSNSGDPCRISGFPAVTMLRADGSVLGDIRVRKLSGEGFQAFLAAPAMPVQDTERSAPSAPVLLVPQGEAAFRLGWTAGTDCEQVGKIAISAPGVSGQVRAVLIPRQLTVCQGQVLITAVSAPD